jgi:hypothetical protein
VLPKAAPVLGLREVPFNLAEGLFSKGAFGEEAFGRDILGVPN